MVWPWDCPRGSDCGHDQQVEMRTLWTVSAQASNSGMPKRVHSTLPSASETSNSHGGMRNLEV
jgi:hypothetical protein